jgi:hypothetical protein
MTRTARASSPQALLKDRSLARNGRDKSLKKGGVHGWGSINDEAYLERDALDDEMLDKQQELLDERQSDVPQRRERSGSTLAEVKGVYYSDSPRLILHCDGLVGLDWLLTICLRH